MQQNIAIHNSLIYILFIPRSPPSFLSIKINVFRSFRSGAFDQSVNFVHSIENLGKELLDAGDRPITNQYQYLNLASLHNFAGKKIFIKNHEDLSSKFAKFKLHTG